MTIREFEFISVPGLPECRVVMNNSIPILFPAIQTRSTTICAIVTIAQLENMDEEFWNAVQECSMLAGTGAFVAGAIPGGLAAVPVFMQIFGSCAASKGFSLLAEQIQLRTETRYGEWI